MRKENLKIKRGRVEGTENGFNSIGVKAKKIKLEYRREQTKLVVEYLKKILES